MSDPLPPLNPSANWFRVAVWIMPTCLFFTTYHMLDPLASMVGGRSVFWLIGWLVVNLAATHALGIFDHKLSGSSTPSENDAFAAEVTAFVGLQILVVPVVLLLIGLIRMLLGA
ncbi:MAG TPA: hypothetical protein VGE67_20125 [Haloferula sp.]